MVFGEAAKQIHSHSREQPDRLEGLPIGKNLEISDSITDHPQHLDVAVARNRPCQSRAINFAGLIGKILADD